jgi:hypothetical protein
MSTNDPTSKAFCTLCASLVLDPTVPDSTRQTVLEAGLCLDGELLFRELFARKDPNALMPIAQCCATDERRPVSIRVVAIQTLGWIRNLTALPEITSAAVSENSALATAGKKALGCLGEPGEVFNAQFAFAQRQAERGFPADARRVLDRCSIFASLMFGSQQAARLQLQLQRLRDQISLKAA